MRVHDDIDMRGRLILQKRNAANEIIEELTAHNTIVLSGRDLVAKQFINEPIEPISHVAVGTGSTEVKATDTALASELFRKPINDIDPSVHLTTTSDNKKKVMITADLDFSEANGALTEAGLFNAEDASDPNGVMYNRVVFPPINKTTDFKLTLIWEIVF
jgi:hypothetical protein